MSDLKKELEELKFEKKGDITTKEGKSHPKFELFDFTEKTEGNVYMWIVEKDGSPHQIKYIGKAGKTLGERCLQHVGGFKGGSKRGVTNGIAFDAII